MTSGRSGRALLVILLLATAACATLGTGRAPSDGGFPAPEGVLTGATSVAGTPDHRAFARLLKELGPKEDPCSGVSFQAESDLKAAPAAMVEFEVTREGEFSGVPSLLGVRGKPRLRIQPCTGAGPKSPPVYIVIVKDTTGRSVYCTGMPAPNGAIFERVKDDGTGELEGSVVRRDRTRLLILVPYHRGGTVWIVRPGAPANLRGSQEVHVLFGSEPPPPPSFAGIGSP